MENIHINIYIYVQMENEFLYSINQNKGERNCQTVSTLPIVGS